MAVKLAVVGCGGISGLHLKGYADLFSRGCREFVITACCDPNEERARARAKEIAGFQGTEPRIFTDIESLLASGVAEAADVCVPHCFHHSTAIPLLEGGVHVLLEKPMGITIKASKKIIEAAEKYGRILAYGENVRRYLTARSCVWAIKKRRLIGDVLLVHIHTISHKPFNYEDPAFKWRGIKLLAGGGMIMDSGAHFADMIQVLFGEVDEVYCTMSSQDNRIIRDAPIFGDTRADVEDTWHAVIRFKSGPPVLWTYSRSLYGQELTFGNYYGTKGTMRDLGFVFHPFQGGGSAVLADGTIVSKEQIQSEYLASLTDEERDRLFPYGATDGFAIEVWDFVNAILTGRKPEMDGNDGLQAKTLCECCYESAAAGKPVKFVDVLEGRVNNYQSSIDDFWKIESRPN